MVPKKNVKTINAVILVLTLTPTAAHMNNATHSAGRDLDP